VRIRINDIGNLSSASRDDRETCVVPSSRNISLTFVRIRINDIGNLIPACRETEKPAWFHLHEYLFNIREDPNHNIGNLIPACREAEKPGWFRLHEYPYTFVRI